LAQPEKHNTMSKYRTDFSKNTGNKMQKRSATTRFALKNKRFRSTQFPMRPNYQQTQ